MEIVVSPLVGISFEQGFVNRPAGARVPGIAIVESAEIISFPIISRK
jgi:hypothetical protein